MEGRLARISSRGDRIGGLHSQLTTGPVSPKPSTDLAQPNWKPAVMTPRAAPKARKTDMALVKIPMIEKATPIPISAEKSGRIAPRMERLKAKTCTSSASTIPRRMRRRRPLRLVVLDGLAAAGDLDRRAVRRGGGRDQRGDGTLGDGRSGFVEGDRREADRPEQVADLGEHRGDGCLNRRGVQDPLRRLYDNLLAVAGMDREVRGEDVLGSGGVGPR